MDVFISWSGDRSKAVAELLKDWLKCVLQASQPWVSSKDVDRGSMWFTEVNKQLNNASIGIICLSRDNLDKPWLLFEAGALAKGLSSSRVCTFLVELETSDISDPLAQFNHTIPSPEGMYSLVETLNKNLGDKSLKENILQTVFEINWPNFDKKYKKILEDLPLDNSTPVRSEKDIQSEILSTVRGISNLQKRRLQEEKETEEEKLKKLFSKLGEEETEMFLDFMSKLNEFNAEKKKLQQ